jgi:predicted GTPase
MLTMNANKRRIVIMGAAGRDFHAFNTNFRDNPSYEVVAFTATQIPGIEKKVYPPALSGDLYPAGIPIRPEDELMGIISEEKINAVVFAYSDVSHEYIMHKASSIIAAGSDFWLLGTTSSMVPSTKKIISVCAVRTGCGKSQTSRKIAAILKGWGKNIVAVRHAMPYGNLEKQKVQRYEVIEDLKKHDCTIEEMEEYEPYLTIGIPVYAGVDYEAILREAEQEADIIIWDGGNNDFSFFLPDLEIVVVDPHRPGDELTYFPGEVNLRRAHVVIINKMDTANPDNIKWVKNNIGRANPTATIIEAESPVFSEQGQMISGQRVLVVEDGPTLTHGGMKFGAGTLAAKQYGAKEIIDPRPWLVGTLKETFENYPGIGNLLPAMGYGKQQVNDLEQTINNSDCDCVVIGTPIDLTRVINIKKPSARVTYELQEIGSPTLETILKNFIERT